MRVASNLQFVSRQPRRPANVAYTRRRFMSAIEDPALGLLVKADRLTRICAALLQAAGASEDESQAVATGCVNANLAGHDSHGVIAIPTYIDRIKAGHIVPGRGVEHRAGLSDHDHHRRPLGLWLPCQR